MTRRGAQIGSLEMLVMNDEIIAMTRRIMRGFEASDDALALDLIDQVDPGGECMSQDETAKRCRADIWNATLMDRQPWDVWDAAGRMVDSSGTCPLLTGTSGPPPSLPENAYQIADPGAH